MISVGLLYNGSVEPEVFSGSARPGHVVVIPERFWVDHGRGARPRYERPQGPRRVLDRLRAGFPVAAHGLGLSIASACFFDRAHLRELLALDREVGFAWISEHLAAFRVDHAESEDHHSGVQIPMAWGRELLELIAGRVDEVQQRMGRALLLENGVEFTPVHDSEWTEVEFWCELHERTSARMLLDLHNLHVNELNLGVEPFAWMSGLPVDAVEEIHVAAGDWIGGIYYDSHCGRSPGRVLELLRFALRRFPRLRAVTFEFHESYFPRIGLEGVADELRALRECVDEAEKSGDVAG